QCVRIAVTPASRGKLAGAKALDDQCQGAVERQVVPPGCPQRQDGKLRVGIIAPLCLAFLLFRFRPHREDRQTLEGRRAFFALVGVWSRSCRGQPAPFCFHPVCGPAYLLFLPGRFGGWGLFFWAGAPPLTPAWTSAANP